MTAAGVQEYIEAIRGLYVGAGKTEKGRILDEAVRVTGYHRKAVVRLVGRRQKAGSPYRRGRPRRYGLELAQALKVLWEASGRVCSRRLHPFVPELIGVLRRHGEQQLTREAEAQLVEMSPSTGYWSLFVGETAGAALARPSRGLCYATAFRYAPSLTGTTRDLASWR
jgi:hypothetical protein